MNKRLLLVVMAIIAACIKVNAQSTNKFEILADSLSDIEQYRPAIENYTKAIALPTKSKLTLSTLYAKRGECKHKLGLQNEAVEDETAATKLNPKNGDAYWTRALCFEKLKKYQSALDDYTMAMPSFQDDKQNLSKLYNNRSNMELNLKMNKEAVADDSIAIVLNPRNEDAYCTRALHTHGLSNIS